jgi:hypothetical protein
MIDSCAGEAAAQTDEFVSKIEAARRLGISTRQLDRLVLDQKLTKYTRVVGKPRVQYRAADLAELLRRSAENAEND